MVWVNETTEEQYVCEFLGGEGDIMYVCGVKEIFQDM